MVTIYDANTGPARIIKTIEVQKGRALMFADPDEGPGLEITGAMMVGTTVIRGRFRWSNELREWTLVEILPDVDEEPPA